MLNSVDNEKILVKGKIGFKMWEKIVMVLMSVFTCGGVAVIFFIEYLRTKDSQVILTNKRLIGNLRDGWIRHKEFDVSLEQISKLKVYKRFGMNGFVFECPQGKFVCDHLLNIEEFSGLLEKYCGVCK